jgi:hypothetical protein
MDDDSDWARSQNAKRAAAGFPSLNDPPKIGSSWEEPQVRLLQREYNPNSLINLLRMWLARKLDTWPSDGSYWCLGCSLNEGKTFVQYTDRIDTVQEHLRRHGPTGRARIRTAIPGKEK